jgi:hypothetical protein
MNDVTHTSSLENARPPAILFGQIQQLTTEGRTDAQIATELGIGVGQIRRIALKNGLKLKRDAVGPAAPAPVAPAAEPAPAVVVGPAIAAIAPIEPPKRQRRARQPRAEAAPSVKASNFDATSGMPGEQLMLIGEITVLASKNNLTPVEFIEQCKQYVAAWEKAMGPVLG